MSFGSNLLSLRKTRGISRSALAEQLDIPYTTLRNYEKDQREPRLELLIRISQMFKVSVDTLLGCGIKAKPPLPDETMQFAQEFSALDRHGKSVIRAVMRCEQKRLEGKED